VDVVELRHEPLPRVELADVVLERPRALAQLRRDALLALEVDAGERDLVAVRV
jgi:hypothetical protein